MLMALANILEPPLLHVTATMLRLLRCNIIAVVIWLHRIQYAHSATKFPLNFLARRLHGNASQTAASSFLGSFQLVPNANITIVY